MFVLTFHHRTRWLRATMLAAPLLGVLAEHGRCDSAQFHFGGKPVDGAKVWSIEPAEPRQLHQPPKIEVQEPPPDEQNADAAQERIREPAPENDLRSHGTSNSLRVSEHDVGVASQADELVLPPYRVVILQPRSSPSPAPAPAPAPTATLAEPPAPVRSELPRGDSHSTAGQNMSLLAAGFSVGVLLTVSLVLLPLIVFLWRIPTAGRTARAPLPQGESSSQAATGIPNFGPAEGTVVGLGGDNPPHVLPFESLTTAFAEQRNREKQRDEQRTAAIVKAIRDETIALQQRLRESRSAA